MKAAVIVFPGSNCDRDVAVALERSLGRPPLMVWHREADFPQVDLIVVPGGFSYGDYLRAGAMAAHSPVMREIVRRAHAGVAILGICNGFQILTETGLLPGALLRNAGLKFICRDVYLRIDATDTPFTAGYDRDQVIRLPIAHNDGNYFADEDTLKVLIDQDRVAFRYCQPWGEADTESNPNGSIGSIAGILNEGRNVLGMMPHPERLADPLLSGTDGRAMLDGLVRVLA
jgi:phosphoribosylformylglycinamidine synthase